MSAHGDPDVISMPVAEVMADLVSGFEQAAARLADIASDVDVS